MCESIFSPKYRGCCPLFNFVTKLYEEKEEKSGELSFKPFCDPIKTFGNTLLMSKVY